MEFISGWGMAGRILAGGSISQLKCYIIRKGNTLDLSNSDASKMC